MKKNIGGRGMNQKLELFKQRWKLMNVILQVQQVITYQLIGVLSKVMQVKNNSQRKLLYDFFQAEEQRRQKEEAFNRAKAEMSEALGVYYKLESNLSGFTRPKHQLNINDNRIERLREMKKKLLENAQANFLESADAYASNVKQLGRDILQKIEDYRQAKSDVSGFIQKVRSELHSLETLNTAKYIRLELETVQNQLNLAEQHFQADTLSDYRQALEISEQISSKISDLTRLSDLRKSEHDKEKSEREKGIGLGVAYGVGYAILFSVPVLLGAFFDSLGMSYLDKPEAGNLVFIPPIIGFLVGFAIGWRKRKKRDDS